MKGTKTMTNEITISPFNRFGAKDVRVAGNTVATIYRERLNRGYRVVGYVVRFRNASQPTKHFHERDFDFDIARTRKAAELFARNAVQ